MATRRFALSRNRCVRPAEHAAFRVTNAFELQALVNQLDVVVPSRLDGRTKQQSESYLMARVLHGLEEQAIDFPLELCHRDRPDFWLSMPSGEVGVEMVEASSDNEIRKDMLRGATSTIFFVEPHVPGEGQKSADVLRAELEEEAEAERQGEVFGDGFVGAPWPEWARVMAHFIVSKAVKARRSGFQRFQRNWLAIYDNWPMAMTTPKPEKMMAALRAELTGSDCFDVFDSIFIVSNGLLFEVTATTDRVVRALDRTPKASWIRRLAWRVTEAVDDLWNRVRPKPG